MSKPGPWWGATVGAVLAYASAVLVHWPPPLYFYPRLGSWDFAVLAGEPAVRWFGWVAYAAVGGLVGMVVGRFIDRRPPWSLVWVLATVVFLLLAWHERQWFLK